MAMPPSPSPPLQEPSPMSPTTTTPLIWEDASRGRILITADLEQRLPQITQTLLQVLLSPPPPRRLRRRSRDGGAGFPPPRILARSVLQSRRQTRPPRRPRQRWQRRQRRRGRRTLRRDVVARQSDETGRGLERRQGRHHSLVLHGRDNRFVNLYHNGRLLGEVLYNILDDVIFVIIGNVLGFERGLVELERDRLASVGEDEVLHRLGTALDLDGVSSDLSWPLGVFRVSPLGPLVVESSEGYFI